MHHYPLCWAHVQGWEQGPWAPTSTQADCCRAGLALSQVDFILQNSCAKLWAAVLEGAPSMDKAGSSGAPCISGRLGALPPPPAAQGMGLAKGGSRGGWPGPQPRAWGSSVTRQGEL